MKEPSASGRDQHEEMGRAMSGDLRAFLSCTPLPTAVLREADTLYVSPAFTRAYGFELDDVATSAEWFRQAFPDDDYRAEVQEESKAAMKRALATGRARLPATLLVTCKDGSTRATTVWMTSVGAGRVVLLLHDSTEHLEALAGRLEIERQLMTLMSNLPGIVYRCKNDRDWTMEFISQGCLELTGYHPSMLRGNRDLSFNDLIVAQDREHVWRTVQEALEYEDVWETSYRIQTADGQIKWVLERGQGVFEDGKLSHLEGLITDITESKHKANALHRSEREVRAASDYARSLLEASLDPFVAISLDGTIADVNAATERVTGKSRDELLGSDFTDYFTEPDRATIGYDQIHREGSTRDFPLAIRSTSGVVTDVLCNAAVYRDASGKVSGVFAVARDITESRKGQAVQARLASIVTSSHDAIMSSDPDGIIVTWNAGAERLFGYSAQEMIGRYVGRLTPPNLTHEVEDLGRRVHSGELISDFETKRLRKDDTLVDVSLALSPVRDPAGEILAISVIARNISERKRTMEQLAQLSTGLTTFNVKLEQRVMERTAELESANEELRLINEKLEKATRAKSEFLAKMSHELRTPLNSILGFSGIMLEGMAGPLTEEQDKQLSMVRSAGRHLLALVNDVLDLSRVEAGHVNLDFEPFDAHDVVRSVVDTVEPLVAESALDLTCAMDDRPALMVSDRRRLEQILFNLLGNAVKFTTEGDITLQVLRDGDSVVFEVADTGCGIPASDFEAIFSEFYQGAKPQAEGTGLGLAVSRRLARMLGGDITVVSEAGHGSTFTVWLPTNPTLP